MSTIVTDPGGRPGPSFLVQCLELSALCRVTYTTLRLRQNSWGEEVPMRERNDTRTRFGWSGLASGVRLLAFAERSLEAIDHVDDKVRRWLFPVTYGRATSLSRDGVRISRAALPRDVQNAIGRQLRAGYPIEQSPPAALANLLGQFEARGNAAPMRRSAA